MWRARLWIPYSSMPIGLGILSNTVMKMIMALLLGRGAFRRIAGGTLAAMLLAGGTMLSYLAAR